jgi:ribosome-associated protein
MQSNELVKVVEHELDQNKGLHISVLDVKNKTSITDYMVIVTATSTRHAKALCDSVAEKVKQLHVQPLGMEGELGSDWILLDLGDVILHVMTGQSREFYQLEKLWSIAAVEQGV